MTRKRVEIELDEDQLVRLDWLCERLGKTRQELLQEGVRWVFRSKDALWNLDDPEERAALDRLQAEALPPWDETAG